MQGYNKQHGDEPLLPEMHILSCQFSQIIQESPKFGTNLPLSNIGHQISLLKKDCFIWEFSDCFPKLWTQGNCFKRKQGINQASPVKPVKLRGGAL